MRTFVPTDEDHMLLEAMTTPLQPEIVYRASVLIRGWQSKDDYRIAMKIHEYQAKQILARYGVPVPRGEVALTADEATEAVRRLGGGTVVVKAQIHAGGRGKGGGVKVARSAAEAEALARQILGMRLVTHQTGPEGRIVGRVLVEEGLEIARELYLGIVLDRSAGRPVVMVSPEGGMDIEKVAAETPDRIFKEHIDPATGLASFQMRKLAFALGLEGPLVSRAGKADDRGL